MRQRPFDILKGIQSELREVNRALDDRIASPEVTGTLLSSASTARSGTDRTYTLRLLAQFEGELTLLGPALSQPCTFAERDGLSYKVDQLGRASNMDTEFLEVCRADLVRHRNELMHGNRTILRVEFDRTLDLMKAFLRNCH